ncbi:MAG: DUF2024 family protein [Balneolaceae bacterium]|nr:DUF2024 family protein [Balneolaceae bacterium]
MKVSVWDTWVTRKDGSMMHFDIIAPEEIKDASVIQAYGNAYLKTKGEDGRPLTSSECRFCHAETVKPEWEKSIHSQSYYILEMENCES